MKNFKTSNATLFAVVVLLNEPVMTSTEIQDTPETKGSSPNMTSKELQTDFSDSMDPFLSDETAPPDHDTELEVDGVGAGVEVEEGGNATGAVERASERKSATDKSSSSPTLPACRKTSQEATSEALPGTEEDEGGPVEADLSEWHPLNQSQSEAKDLNQTQDTTFVNDSLAHGSDEKHVPIPIPRSQTSNLNLQIVTKAPSPQPWDLVDPPPSNNGDATDFYSTLGTKNFATLQNKSNSRPAIPQSSYYFGPPSTDTAYGTNPVGHIGIHHPREVFRVERDYTGGELVQFAATYPLELEGRITPTQFLETVNAINELLISAHSIRHSFFNNLLAVFTLQVSRLIIPSHYDTEMGRLEHLVQDLNTKLYNPVGLNIRWPRKVAFLFLEIEYY